MSKLPIYIILFLLISPAVTRAQQTLRFRHLDIEDGLSHSLINTILQDRQGFIWIGTQDGLNRYDGYRFRVFRPEPNQANTIYGKWVTELFEDSREQLWIRFRSGGLNRYDPDKQQFHLYLHDPTDPASISGDFQSDFRFNGNMDRSIIESRDGSVWIGTTQGLNRYDPEQDCFESFRHAGDDPYSLTGDHITSLLEAPDGFIWVGTTQGLNRFDPRTGKCRRLVHDPLQPRGGLSDNYIRTLFLDTRGNLWAGTRWGGLNRIRLELPSGQFNCQAYLYDQERPPHERLDEIITVRETRNGEIWVCAETGIFYKRPGQDDFSILESPARLPKMRYLLEDSAGNIWTGGGENNLGLVRIPPDRSKVEWFSHNDMLPFSLSTNAVSWLFEDRTGVLWIGTTKGGINLLDNNRKQFDYYFHDPSNPNSLNADDVYSIYEDDGGTLWVGTIKGLNRIDPLTSQVRIYEKDPRRPDGIAGRIVGVIEPDPAGFLWLGYFDYKISKFYPDTDRFQHFHHNELDPRSYLAWSLRDILLDQKGNCWFGACTHGLARLEPDGRSFRYFPQLPPSQEQSSKNHKIYCLHEDREGILWIGTQEVGLKRFDPKTNSFTHFHYDPNAPGGISSNEIKCIFEDEEGFLWLGTGGGGLNRFDKRTGRITLYTTADGLSNNTISGILPDDQGNLWLSTNRGLSRFDPKTATFKNYYVEDGLQSNEFNEGAYYKNKNGRMYFGGVNGLTAFHPDSITQNPHLPAVTITELRIFNEPVLPGDSINGKVIITQAIDRTGHLRLTYQENVFSLEFTALHFAAPGKNRFAYQLEGFDNDWIYTDAEKRYATYTNLDPGDYTFHVRATNNDGLWNQAGASLRLTILPPWWDTPWFRRSLFVFLILAAYAIIRLRIRRLKDQKKRLEHLIGERTSELTLANSELEASREAILHQKEQIESQTRHLEKQNRNIRLLSEIGQNITSAVRIEEIMTKIYQSINGLMDAPSFSVGQINDERRTVDFFAFKTPGGDLTELEISLDDEHHLSIWAIRNGEMVFINDLETEINTYFDDVPDQYQLAPPYRSAVYLPLYATSGKIIGILIVKSPRNNTYTRFHLNVLKNLAAYIAIALDNARAYREIKEQSEQLRKMDEIKTRFYTNISHEFRTPLTLIMGTVSDLTDSAELPPAQKRSLRRLERNARRLLRLVTQIVDLSKLEDGVLKLEVHPGDVVQQIKLIADSFENFATQKGIDFAFVTNRSQAHGYLDRDKIEKIIYNLLFNAFKFTDEGGRICLSLGVSQEAGGPRHLDLTIRDTGVGIPPEDLEHIFQRFYQGNSLARRRGEGAGIGLSLVHHLVALHLGTIKVESKTGEEDHGTVFRIRIPIDREAYPAEVVTDFIPGANGFSSHLSEDFHEENDQIEMLIQPLDQVYRPTVLVVEDNLDMRRFIREALNGSFLVLESANGKTGLTMARENHPEVIISDVMMPHLDGFEFCRRLKADDTICHIPILMLTARTSSEAEFEGLNAGADDYITKPFRPELLRIKLQNIIQGRRRLTERFKRDIWMDVSSVSSAPGDEQLLRRAIEVIERHLADPGLDVALFTREMAISRTVLYEKIKSLTDLSINDLIKTHRLKVAARLLIEKNLTIGEVSFQVGFNDPKYFAKCFRKQFGKSPREFLQSYAGPESG